MHHTHIYYFFYAKTKNHHYFRAKDEEDIIDSSSNTSIDFISNPRHMREFPPLDAWAAVLYTIYCFFYKIIYSKYQVTASKTDDVFSIFI
jgi:hypothetical protein